jgi:hypothetical protein
MDGEPLIPGMLGKHRRREGDFAFGQKSLEGGKRVFNFWFLVFGFSF